MTPSERLRLTFELIASHPRDLIDVQDILFTMGQMDTDYMQHWAAELQLGDALRQAIVQRDETTDGV